MQKLGAVIVSIYKTENNKMYFEVKADNDDVLPVSYVIEDTLKLY